jgi:D-alanine-D-alanine ligase
LPDLAIIFGGPSPEHDVSILTGLQAARELTTTADASPRALYWSKTGEWFDVDPRLEASAFVDGVPRGATPLRLVTGPGGGFVADRGRFGRAKPVELDVAMICCHGGPGEDGTLQAALDLAGIAYAGPSVAGAGLGMDKLAFAGVMAAAGVKTLPRVEVDEHTDEVGFDGPYIVKPRFGGSSIGIAVVADLPTARTLVMTSRHLSSGAVLEPYRSDLIDLQIAARSWPALQLSAVERPLRTARAGGAAGQPEILGYADKYQGGEGMASAPRELPAVVGDDVSAEIRRLALEVARLVSLRGVARIDFLSDDHEVYVNEVNTIPGSMARYLWIDPPLSFGTLLSDLLAEARERPTHVYTSHGADGTVLRGAGSIAAKLA